jgi:hypothetical protein
MDINLKNVNTSAQAVTKICYTEEIRNLDYKIKCNDLKDLKECIKIIDSYNEFDANRINKALDSYANWKQGDREFLSYYVARESSPAIYIAMPLQVYGSTPIINEGHEVVVSEDVFHTKIAEFARIAKADELDITKDYYITCRLWWD